MFVFQQAVYPSTKSERTDKDKQKDNLLRQGGELPSHPLEPLV